MFAQSAEPPHELVAAAANVQGRKDHPQTLSTKFNVKRICIQGGTTLQTLQQDSMTMKQMVPTA